MHRALVLVTVVLGACASAAPRPPPAAPPAVVQPPDPRGNADGSAAVVRSLDDAVARHIALPADVDLATSMVVIVPARSHGVVTPSEQTERDGRLAITLEVVDEDPEPCCGMGGCTAAWEERQINATSYVLVVLPRTDLPVFAIVRYPAGIRCVAA
ncbi:MAG: hypothetical protein K8W52_15780 [Deltaproteobacteria bacterium]|nr:hypothetical protein [Deltaproteobacteria bacterium]